MKKSWGMVLFVLFFLMPVLAQVDVVKIPDEKPKNIIDLVYIGILMVMVNAPIWIREGFKHFDFKKKNGIITQIKADTGDLKNTMKIINNNMKNHLQNDTLTTERLEKSISENKEMIIGHITAKG